MISRAINQKTARHLAYEAFLDLARNLDCAGVEPRNDLGRPLFLKHKAELVDAIEAVGGPTKFKLVHDTFQHTIAGGGPIFPDYTAMVHISGIADPLPPLDDKLDAHRGLVDGGDRCGTIDQIAAFIAAGYQGSFSFECTRAAVQDSKSLENDIRLSFDFIERSLASR